MEEGSRAKAPLRQALPLLASWFAGGLVLAICGPQPSYLATGVVATVMGLSILGPAAACLSRTWARQGRPGAAWRWGFCLAPALVVTGLAAPALRPVPGLPALAALVLMAATVVGHDAALAARRCRAQARLRRGWAALLPGLLSLAAIGGYACLGCAIGVFRLLASLRGGS